jgi:hypothetical protein
VSDEPDEDAPTPPDEPAPADEPVAPEPEPDEVDEPVEPLPEPEDFAQSANAHDVAFALLNLVLAKAKDALAPDHRVAFLASELNEAQRRLASATEYGAALRRRLEAATDELVATKDERNALRVRCRSVEYNLNELMRQTGTTSTAAFRDGVQHALNGLMRELPKANA